VQFPADYWVQLKVNYDMWERNHDTTRRADAWLGEVDRLPILGEFDRLQRLNLLHLLNRVATVKATIKHSATTSSDDMNLLRESLHQYGEFSLR
jgi:hypothetical protein